MDLPVEILNRIIHYLIIDTNKTSFLTAFPETVRELVHRDSRARLHPTRACIALFAIAHKQVMHSVIPEVHMVGPNGPMSEAYLNHNRLLFAYIVRAELAFKFHDCPSLGRLQQNQQLAWTASATISRAREAFSKATIIYIEIKTCNCRVHLRGQGNAIAGVKDYGPGLKRLLNQHFPPALEAIIQGVRDGKFNKKYVTTGGARWTGKTENLSRLDASEVAEKMMEKFWEKSKVWLV